MSRKIPYKDIMNRIKDDVDYIADEAYTKGYTDGRKQAKTQAELDVAHDIENVAKENYQKGLDDAWECARRITCLPQDGGISNSGLDAIFEISNIQEIMKNFSVSEAMERIKAYEEEQNGIRVGDEVKATLGNAIVTYVTEEIAEYIYWSGKYGGDYLENLERTGRHFGEIETLLEKERGETI